MKLTIMEVSALVFAAGISATIVAMYSGDRAAPVLSDVRVEVMSETCMLNGGTYEIEYNQRHQPIDVLCGFKVTSNY